MGKMKNLSVGWVSMKFEALNQISLYQEYVIFKMQLIIIIMKNIAGKLQDKINWFPGHMHKALRVIRENTKNVDVFLQIRDSRIPYSSKNPEFDAIVKASQKEKVIIFNKMDLCDLKKTQKIIKDYNSYGITCYGVSTTKHDDMRKLVGFLKNKYQRKYQQVGLWFMAFGMPNVGKSSLLNQLRSISDLQNKATASKVTASVCTTKGTKGFKFLQNPLMFIMDSPGVAVPSVIPNQLGLKLSLLGVIRDNIVDKMTVAEYMYEKFESENNDKYWKNLQISKPDDFEDFFFKIRDRYKLHDYDAVCDYAINKFREGDLGPFTLDTPQDQ